MSRRPGRSRRREDAGVTPGQLRLIASRPRVQGYLAPTTGTRYESRTRFYTYRAATRVRLAFPRYYLANTGVQSLLPNPFTLTCAIEDPGAGTYAPVTFGGLTSYPVQTSGSALIWSDEIGDLPANALRFVRVGCQVSLGQTVPGAQVSPFDGSIEQAVLTNGGASQVYATGVMSTAAPYTQTAPNEGGYTPIAIVGYPVGQQHSVLIFGDSIVDTFDHIPDSGGHYGWIARALRSAGIPHTKASRGSNRAINSTPAMAPKQYELCRYATHVVAHLGINDFGGGSSAAQLKSDLLAMVNGCKAYGCRVYLSLLCPVTTGSWGSEDAQTGYGVGCGPGGMRDEINDWILSLAADGPISGAIDHRQYIENTANRKWLAGKSLDGLHPGLNGASPVHTAMAQAMTDAIATW